MPISACYWKSVVAACDPVQQKYAKHIPWKSICGYQTYNLLTLYPEARPLKHDKELV